MKLNRERRILPWGFLAGVNSRISHTGGRLVFQEGPTCTSNNEIIPNFTRAKCTEARANNIAGG
eukprot:5558317-Pleurochrysis_carterae.AAC.1